ncbi:28S ribosomal protein S6, mitochondrial [Sphaerodactylus townsendi]|uniref:28S ribosomal protein S6, mitochondrial n=1 Tax=Sphaerodactylus townsendi TaxID=933632 RepID=UPI002026EFAC|nr:28S ribosomal protein S6, mitochondrial [Sphaerodactylus townsendi]
MPSHIGLEVISYVPLATAMELSEDGPANVLGHSKALLSCKLPILPPVFRSDREYVLGSGVSLDAARSRGTEADATPQPRKNPEKRAGQDYGKRRRRSETRCHSASSSVGERFALATQPARREQEPGGKGTLLLRQRRVRGREKGGEADGERRARAPDDCRRGGSNRRALPSAPFKQRHPPAASLSVHPGTRSVGAAAASTRLPLSPLSGSRARPQTMPRYELALILKAMQRPEVAATLKRTVEALMERGAVVRNLENLGERTLPYKISKHNQRHTRGGYFLIDFISPPAAVSDVLERLGRDIDVIRSSVLKHQEMKTEECMGIIPVNYEDMLNTKKK